MLYKEIVNPVSGRKVSIYGKIGQSVLKNYLSQIGGAQKTYSSYSCKLGDKGVNGVNITIDNCESQWDSSGVPGLSRCKLTNKNVCRKRQCASKKRGSKNVAKLKSSYRSTTTSPPSQQIVKPGTTANVFLYNIPEHKKASIFHDRDRFIHPQEQYDTIVTNVKFTLDFDEAGDYEELLQLLLKSEEGDKIKEGDLIEDYEKSGYRTVGVYLIHKNSAGELELGNLDYEEDDYGHIGSGFSLGPKFPPGYWTNAPFLNAYWHHREAQMEPVSRELWSNITIDDLVEVSKDKIEYIFDSEIADWTKKLVKKYYSKVVYNWGTLEFSGKKEEVIDKLNKLKTYNPIPGRLVEEMYFQPIGNNTSTISDVSIWWEI